jgi:hypothetical protein
VKSRKFVATEALLAAHRATVLECGDERRFKQYLIAWPSRLQMQRAQNRTGLVMNDDSAPDKEFDH